jgi:ectoine hydroxylase-related dioxygenase (phytanoyl-CoA dioxygenase family)
VSAPSNHSVPRLSASDSVADLIAALRESGGIVVEDLLEEDTLHAINSEVGAAVEAADPARPHMHAGLDFFFGKRTRHVTSVTAKSPTFATEVLCHAVYLGICDEILAPSCGSYVLNLAHILDRGPGAEAQILHRDELVWSYVPKPHPELQVASLIALVDFTEENGATRLVPGSHLWPKDRVAEEHEAVHAEMKAGSAVIYLGSTIHGGGANRTESAWRRGVHLSYTLGWLRTEENNYLGTPPEVARTLPRRAQELLGYSVHTDAIGAYLGMLDMRDPVDMLDDGSL